MTKEEQQARMAICLGCEFCINGRTCGKCNCNLGYKTWKADWACPIGKFGVLNPEKRSCQN